LAAGLASLGPGHILDGEVSCLDDIGRSDFDRVLRRARRRRWYPGADLVVYCVFDLLVKNGRDIRDRTYERRKAALASLLSKRPASLLYVDHDANGRWLIEQALALQLEGIVGKRGSSTYQAGIRSPDWIKIKRPGAVPPNRFRRALRQHLTVATGLSPLRLQAAQACLWLLPHQAAQLVPLPLSIPPLRWLKA